MQIHSNERAWGEGYRRKLVVSEYGGRRSGSMVVRPLPDVWTAVLAKQVNRAVLVSGRRLLTGKRSRPLSFARARQSTESQLPIGWSRATGGACKATRTSEDGTILVKAPPAVTGAGGRHPRHPRGLASSWNRERRTLRRAWPPQRVAAHVAGGCARDESSEAGASE